MKTIKTYTKQLRAVPSPAERGVLTKLSTPQKIQDFLDRFPTREGMRGGVHVRSPLQAYKSGRFHCMEGALFAALALAYHGWRPMLMDLQSVPHDWDHVVALFKQNGLWGAISKTNHPVLRWRDPVYRTPRELAMSYFNEYFLPDRGKHFRKKTMVAYSKPFDLSRYPPERWLDTPSLDWLAEELDASPHLPTLSARMRKNLRRADFIEIRALRLREWTRDGKKARSFNA